MRKYLWIIYLISFSLCGCQEPQKPIDRIFIRGYSVHLATGRESRPLWLEGDVLEKSGDMWKIKVKGGGVQWVDIKKEIWRTQ